MLMDILAKRESEIDFINGAIADRGEQLGVLVPLNRAMWQLVKGLEHSWLDASMSDPS
jgi:2-dehydropantoate 2-reductase